MKRKVKKGNVPQASSRNEHKVALFVRAGNAGCAVAVDTRTKKVPSALRQSDRKDNKRALKDGMKSGDWD